MSNRLWMYQLNPKTEHVFIRSRGKPLATTADNLLQLLESEGPVQREWYVVKNFRQAELGQPVVVKVGTGDKTGIVAFGWLDSIDAEKKEIDIRFDMTRTRKLMQHPVPLAVVRATIPIDRSNLVDITRYRRMVIQWIDGKIGNVPKRKARSTEGTLSISRFDEREAPKKPKPGYGHSSPVERARMLEKANRGHHGLLVALSRQLSKNGWTSIEHAKKAFDLRARHRRRWILFEAKTLTEQNEIHQIRAGLSQLLEYRYFHPQLKSHHLCLVLSRPLSARAKRFVGLLESLRVAVVWNREGSFRGAGRTASFLLGRVVS